MAGAGCRGGWRGGGTTHRRAPLLRSRPPACPRPPPGAVGAGVPARDLAGRTCAGRRGAALRRHLAADTRHRAWLHPLKGCQGLPEAGVAPPPPLRARGGRAAAGGCLSLLEPPPPPPGGRLRSGGASGAGWVEEVGRLLAGGSLLPRRWGENSAGLCEALSWESLSSSRA